MISTLGKTLVETTVLGAAALGGALLGAGIQGGGLQGSVSFKVPKFNGISIINPFGKKKKWDIEINVKMDFFIMHTIKIVLQKLNSRKIGKIRELLVFEIFLPVFRELVF